ncbi:hypothetical protein LDENG_00185890 [Lucifuga dentata]|nr:hypothetical protein LDENG_00185890 [Lucifuga dentata]
MRATLLLVSLLLSLEWMWWAESQHVHSMPGSPYNISKNDTNLLQAVAIATDSFNNQSNDAFLFRVSSIQRAQQQLVKGFMYIMDVEISRTICHKRDKKDLSSCDFQPEGPLHQVTTSPFCSITCTHHVLQ